MIIHFRVKAFPKLVFHLFVSISNLWPWSIVVDNASPSITVCITVNSGHGVHIAPPFVGGYQLRCVNIWRSQIREKKQQLSEANTHVRKPGWKPKNGEALKSRESRRRGVWVWEKFLSFDCKIGILWWILTCSIQLFFIKAVKSCKKPSFPFLDRSTSSLCSSFSPSPPISCDAVRKSHNQ